MFEMASSRMLPQCPSTAELWPLEASSPEAGVHTQGGLLQSPEVLIPPSPGSPERFLIQEHSFYWPLLCPRPRGCARYSWLRTTMPSHSLPHCAILFGFHKNKTKQLLPPGMQIKPWVPSYPPSQML